MKLKKMFNKNTKNINSFVSIMLAGFLSIIAVISTVLLLHMSPPQNMALAFLIIGILLFQLVWLIWIQWKYLQPLERISKNTGPHSKMDLYEEKLYSGYVGELVKKEAISMNEKSTATMLNMQASLYALQSQIKPHFLYNTLETIRSQAINRKADEIAEMTEALATLFRYSISRPNEMVTLADEIENAKNYLMIQKYRFPNKFDVKWCIDENEDVLQCILPILTIQPLVENAIHHGIEKKIDRGSISIRVQEAQQELLITISDNGEGMTEDLLEQIRKRIDTVIDFASGDTIIKQNKRKAGIALNNVHQRIRMMFGSDYGLQLYSTPGVGTTVELRIPKKNRTDHSNFAK